MIVSLGGVTEKCIMTVMNTFFFHVNDQKMNDQLFARERRK